MKNRAFRIMMVTGVLAASLLMTTAYAEGEKKEAATEAVTESASEKDSEADAEELLGTFKGEKHIDAMNCDIAVEITLKEDGKFLYYRAPMKIDMNGGGEMPELKDEGTYKVDGEEISFEGKELGEFQITVKTEKDEVSLEGKIPTGGPSTDLTLEKQAEEETESESETETKNTEKE